MAQSSASQRLHAIAARLKAEGERGLQLEVARTMRTAARPLVKSAEAAARRQLPKEGGLNEIVATRHTTVSVLTGSRTAGVRLKRARKDAASYQTNRGYLYHKTFGEKPWRKQELPNAAGWWSDTLANEAPAVTPLLVAEMNRIGRRIQDGY